MPYPKMRPSSLNQGYGEGSAKAPAVPDAGQATAPTMSSSPQGGAPALPAWLRSTPKAAPQTPTPAPFKLEDVDRDMPQLVGSIKEQLDKRLSELPEDQKNSMFWKGYQQYGGDPMAKMIARRMMTNRMESLAKRELGGVDKWMSFFGWR